jgi:hypothetical protein
MDDINILMYNESIDVIEPLGIGRLAKSCNLVLTH